MEDRKYLTKSAKKHLNNGIACWQKARKIRLLQRFLTYTRNKVINDKIDQEIIATSESKLDDVKRKSLEKTILIGIFEFLVSLINFYLSYHIPYRLAFFNDHQVPELYIHDLVLDGVLFVSIIIRIYVHRGKAIKVISAKSPFFIFNFFFHFGFYSDLISVIPLYMIENKWYWFKLPRILRVNSIVEWIMNLKPPSKRLKNFIMNHYAVYNTFLTVLWFCNMIMITCHCIACLWFYIPNELSTPNELTWLGPSWETYSTGDNYMRSLYWTAVTFSSVGYGDITGKTTQEYIYSMFVMFLGIMSFGYFMGSLTSLISAYQTKQEKIRYRENELTQWLIFVEDQIQDKKAQIELNEKITNYFNHKWACDPASLSGFDNYFMMLPPDIAQELSAHLFGHRLNIFDLFLKNFPDIKFEIASKLHTEKYICPGEMIKVGEKNQFIYLITSGSISVGVPELGYSISLGEGSYFGEDSAMFGDESQMSFYNTGEALLYFFKFMDLKGIFKRNKLQLWEFAKISFKRVKYFEAINTLKFSNGVYVSDQELETLSGQFNLSDTSMGLDEENEYNERSKKLYELFFKKDKEEVSPEAKKVVDKVKLESEKFGKELQNVQKKYEDELKRMISRIDSAIEGIKGQ